MEPCEAYELEILADYAARRLSRADVEALRCHLTACPQCRQVVTQLLELRRAVQRLPALAAQEVDPADHRAVMFEAARLLARDAVGASGLARDAVGASGLAAAPQKPRMRRPHLLRDWLRTRAARTALVAATALLIVFVSVFFELASRPRAGRVAGRTVSAKGKILIDGTSAALRPDAELRDGQAIRTSAGARLAVELSGGVRVELDENTSLALEAAPAGSQHAGACRLFEGQVFVGAAAQQPGTLVEVRTTVGSVQAASGQFNLKVVPRSFAERGPGPRAARLSSPKSGAQAGLVMLALAQPDVLGNVGPQAQIELTVLDGEVDFYVPGDRNPWRVTADEQLVYDPAAVMPQVRAVLAERFVLWRLSDEELFRAAQQHLSELFGGQVRVLSGARLRIDYGFLTSAELADWQVVGDCWTLYRNALRMRLPTGQARLAAGERAEIISRAAFVGDLEVGFEATVDPARATAVQWQLRYAPTSSAPAAQAGAAEPGRATVIGATETRGDAEGALRVSLTVGDETRSTRSEQSPGSVFTFGGRLEKGTAYASLQEGDVLAVAVPDAILRRLHDADNPAAMNVVVATGGPDVFISKLTVIGQPDPRWLRQALGSLLERREAQDR